MAGAIDIAVLQAAQITEAQVADVVAEIAERLRDGRSQPLSRLPEQHLRVIATLAIGNAERFGDLQSDINDLVKTRAERFPLNLAKYFKTRIADERRAADEQNRVAKQVANKGQHSGTPDVDFVVKEFNEHWLHVRMGSEEAVMELETLEPVRIKTFVGLYRHELARDGVDNNGKDILVPKGTAWLDHRDHAIARAGLVFEPDKPGGFLPGRRIGKAYNTWTGFGVEPIEGDISWFKQFMAEGLCGGQGVQFDYFWNLYAYMIQNPGIPTTIFTVLAHASEGIGKGVFGHAICNLYGKHGRFINDQDYLTGRFNYSTLANKCFACCDEASFAGNKRDAAKMRSLVSEPKITVERKYFDSEEVTNHINFLMLMNAWHATDASLTSRRPFIPTIVDWHRGDRPYWNNITGLLYDNDRRGLKHLLYAFQHTDVSKFDHRSVPITEATIEQRKRTARHDPWGFFSDMLQRGFPCRSRFGHEDELHVWMSTASTLWLHTGYLQWCDDQRLGQHGRRGLDDFGKFIAKELKLQPVHARNMIVGESSTQGEAGVLRKRRPSYRLGTEAEFEALIAARMRGDMDYELATPPEEEDEPDSPIPPPSQGTFDYDQEPE